MAVGDHEVLAAAARMLRAAPEPGWAALEPRVLDAVRETPRGGWPIVIEDPRPNTSPGVLAVSDLAVRSLLSRALRSDPDITPIDIGVDVEDGVLHAVRVRLLGRYGADLRAAAARALDTCAAVLADAVGPTSAALDVAIVDVEA